MANILIIGPAWVGDMVMAQSLFKALKSLNPSNQLDVLAPRANHALLSRMKEIREAIDLPIDHGELAITQRYQLASALRKKHYDQAIVLPNSWKSALIPYLAKIPLRTGYRGEMRWGLLNDLRRLEKVHHPLMIEQFVALAFPKDKILPKTLPLLSLTVDETSKKRVSDKFELCLSKPTLVLCPGAEFGSSKRWPVEHYASVANQKIKEGFQVWLLGSPKDGVIAEEIQTKTDNRCLNLSGRTTLDEAIVLLSLAQDVVTNDSGLMHIAAALNKPLIALYGSTDPSFTPPLQQDAEILRLGLSCSPCFKRECPLQHHRCMKDLSPDLVLNLLSKVEAR